jgi:hypothetical protein
LWYLHQQWWPGQLQQFCISESVHRSSRCFGLSAKTTSPDLYTCIKKRRSGLTRVYLGLPGPGLTRQVDRVSPDQLSSEFFLRSRPVSCLGQSGPGSTHQTGPGFKTITCVPTVWIACSIIPRCLCTVLCVTDFIVVGYRLVIWWVN